MANPSDSNISLTLDYEPMDDEGGQEGENLLKLLGGGLAKTIRNLMAVETAKAIQQIQAKVVATDERASSSTDSSREAGASSSMGVPSRARTGGEILKVFDPDDQKCNISRWLSNIDKQGRIHGWSEYERTYFMQAKLQGAARRWYNRLDKYDLSWEEWKVSLEKAFSRQQDYAESLTEMLRRNKKEGETMTRYYHDKMALIARCELVGDKALSCLIQGLPKALQGKARAFKCKDCGDLYAGFLSSFDKYQDQASSDLKRRYSDVEQVPSKQFRKEYPQSKTVAHGEARFRCYNCQQMGTHRSKDCPKPKAERCMLCGGVGHSRKECRQRPSTSSGDGKKYQDDRL